MHRDGVEGGGVLSLKSVAESAITDMDKSARNMQHGMFRWTLARKCSVHRDGVTEEHEQRNGCGLGVQYIRGTGTAAECGPY